MRTSKRKQNQEMGDVIKLRGAIEWALRDAATGEIIQTGYNENVVVTAGRVWMLARIGSSSTDTISRIYLGNSTQATATALTALSASFSSKAIGTVSSAQYTSNPPSYEFQASWASGDTHANSTNIVEFGLYAKDTMVGYLTTSAAINFQSTNTLAISYRLSN